MVSTIVKMILGKSIAKDVVRISVKNGTRNESVVKEKLGVSSIDEFMKMDIHEYQRRRES